MEKVKLTKEQAEAICELRLGRNEVSRKWTDDEIVIRHIKEGFNTDKKKCLNSLSLNNLIRALYIGYEVELTEQEKIQELWKFETNNTLVASYRSGVRDVLSALGRGDLIPKEVDYAKGTY